MEAKGAEINCEKGSNQGRGAHGWTEEEKTGITC